MSGPMILALAMVLDAALGEPDWLWRRLPHPAVLMGRLIGWAERQVNHGMGRKAKGVGLVMGLVLLGAFLGQVLQALGPVIEVLLVAILLAQRSLVQHVARVADGVRLSLPQARRSVALIVSRDTARMGPAAIARSAIESAAENLSDGVMAPALWFLVAGLPGLLIYKLINTADSMIGYRTARLEEFGWAAARLDDVLNWIPARLTALAIALPAGVIPQWPAIRRDAALHRSPNAGWPEAAMARALSVALAGPRAYDGRMQDFAWVNPTGAKDIGAIEIDHCLRQLWRAWGLALACFLVLVLIMM